MILRRLLTATATAVFLLPATVIAAQTPVAGNSNQTDAVRGEYNGFRANNDWLFYHLDVRVELEKKFPSGKNAIRFKMLKDGSRIQLELTSVLKIEKILLNETVLKYEREGRTAFD